MEKHVSRKCVLTVQCDYFEVFNKIIGENVYSCYFHVNILCFAHNIYVHGGHLNLPGHCCVDKHRNMQTN